MKLSERQLQDLSRFARLPDGNVLKSFLQEQLAEYDRELRNAPPDKVQVCQGKAQAIYALMGVIETAGLRLQQSQSSKPRSVIPPQSYEADGL